MLLTFKVSAGTGEIGLTLVRTCIDEASASYFLMIATALNSLSCKLEPQTGELHFTDIHNHSCDLTLALFIQFYLFFVQEYFFLYKHFFS